MKSKRTGSIAAIIVGAAIAGFGVASAAPGQGGHHGPPHGSRCMPSHLKKHLATYDANKNGRLDPEEHHALEEARRRADLVKYDKDGDGTLSPKERETMRYDHMVELFESVDANRDAEISAAEAKGSCTPLEWGFERVDADNSGTITWAEFEKAAPRGPRHHRHHGPPGGAGR